jgi:hypothetical protein
MHTLLSLSLRRVSYQGKLPGTGPLWSARAFLTSNVPSGQPRGGTKESAAMPQHRQRADGRRCACSFSLCPLSLFLVLHHFLSSHFLFNQTYHCGVCSITQVGCHAALCRLNQVLMLVITTLSLSLSLSLSPEAALNGQLAGCNAVFCVSRTCSDIHLLLHALRIECLDFHVENVFNEPVR